MGRVQYGKKIDWFLAGVVVKKKMSPRLATCIACTVVPSIAADVEEHVSGKICDGCIWVGATVIKKLANSDFGSHCHMDLFQA